MAKITLAPLIHKNQKQVKIEFKYNYELKELIRNFPLSKWSTTHKTFYIPFYKKNVNDLFLYLRSKNHFVDYKLLKTQPKVKVTNKAKQRNALKEEFNLPINAFEKWMIQKRYSYNTVKTYKAMLIQFFRYHHSKSINAINKQDLIDFNINYILANNYSYTYQNQMVNALKLFFEQTTNTFLDTNTLERPKKSKRLPEVLSIDEVKQLLYIIKNVKHKTLISLLYSCGLRIGEALNLKLNDINSKRRLIHIKSAKGRKDRYLPLPDTMLDLLKRYYKSYKPKYYVFEGSSGGQYSNSSARKVLINALSQTNIKRYVTLHTLRHSYATHLLENGTDVRFIQELLGHNDPKTTMIYTHVSTTSLKNIKNPFDDFKI